MAEEEVTATVQASPEAAAFGEGLEECAWCRYGWPAFVGGALGIAAASIAKMEPARGALWGVVGGLCYGGVYGGRKRA